MTTFTPILDAQIDEKSPMIAPLMEAYRDNLIASFEGAAGAPRVQPGAFGSVVAGDELRAGNMLSGGSFGVVQAGTLRVKTTQTAPANSTNIQVFRNGVQVFTSVANLSSRTLDVTVQPFDSVVVDFSNDSGASRWTLSTDGGNLWCANPSRNVGVTGNTYP